MTQISCFDLILSFKESVAMYTQKYTTKTLDHLGLVSGFCKDISLVKQIDSKLPKQSDSAKISHGELVLAMILNGLGFVGRTLHMFPQYYESKPVDRLIGAHIKSEYINDDALGRTLDKLYENDVSQLYQEISEKVVKHLRLPCDGLHLDSTSFHVDGEYEEDGEKTSHIKLTKGYSRDHRPELNQVILNLITENQAGIPVYMQACSGNTNDTDSFKKIVRAHIKSLKSAHNNKYIVADAALYSKDTIQFLQKDNQYFITRVPQKLREAKALINGVNELDFKSLENGYRAVWVESHYADIPQQWLFVKSDAATKREKDTFKKKLTKETEKSLKSFQKLCRKTFKCEEDAHAALAQWEASNAFIKIDDASLKSVKQYSKSGRPKKNEVPVLAYHISGSPYSCLNTVENESLKKGIFILATNDCSGKLGMQKMLDTYKAQQNVEKGFRFLKSPDFLTSSLYLKSPERIEALLMIMTCCLMVYAAIEHLIRYQLKEKELYFPDMKNKPCQKPTARWVFQCFIGIHELTVEKEGTGVVNLKPQHLTIISALGPPYELVYS